MPATSPPVLILLAAGNASRFGADKLRASLPDGTPVAVAAARACVAAGVETVAVLRPDQLELAGLLQAAGAATIFSDDARKGMGHSLAAGIAARSEAGGWLVALADMPALQAATVAAVRDALLAGAVLAAPVVDGRRGHPVGFAANYRDELLALTGDTGAREILRREAAQLLEIPSEDRGALLDIDRPADLAAVAGTSA